jgi:hypothetical protein
MMDQSAREDRESHLLRTLAIGGLDTRQVVRLERDLQALRESRHREEEWSRLTRADHQPGFRTVDPF